MYWRESRETRKFCGFLKSELLRSRFSDFFENWQNFPLKNIKITFKNILQPYPQNLFPQKPFQSSNNDNPLKVPLFHIKTLEKKILENVHYSQINVYMNTLKNFPFHTNINVFTPLAIFSLKTRSLKSYNFFKLFYNLILLSKILDFRSEKNSENQL